jgi:hypothetical protein
LLDTSESLLERIASRNQDEDWERLLSVYPPFIDQQVRRYPQLLDEQLDELSDPASLAAQRWDTEHDKEVLRRVVEIVRQDVNPMHWRAFQKLNSIGTGLLWHVSVWRLLSHL